MAQRTKIPFEHKCIIYFWRYQFNLINKLWSWKNVVVELLSVFLCKKQYEALLPLKTRIHRNCGIWLSFFFFACVYLVRMVNNVTTINSMFGFATTYSLSLSLSLYSLVSDFLFTLFLYFHLICIKTSITLMY